MNIRFAEGVIRCRITRAELELLSNGRALVLEVDLPRNHAFRLSVRPAAIGGWQLDSDPTGIWISVPRAALESLAQMLPSREGIGEAFDTARGSVRVSLEVDVKRRLG